MTAADTLVVLEESSGPISPRYRYELSLRVERAGDDGEIKATFARRGAGGDADASALLDAGRLQALYATLAAAGLERCADDLVPPGAEQRTGASINHVIVKRAARDGAGALDIRFRYVSADLGAEDDAHAPHRAVIGAIKAFAAEL